MLGALGISYLFSKSNYNLENENNIFNFIISILKIVRHEDDRKEMIQNMKLLIGNTFTNNFKNYLLRKYSSDHEFLKLFD